MALIVAWIMAGLLPVAGWLGWRAARRVAPPPPPPHDDEGALARLQLLQAHQQALMDSIDDLAWLKDRECRFLVVNRKFLDVFHLPPGALVGKSDYDLSPPAMAKHYQDDDRAVMASRQPRRVEEQIHRADGEIGWAETIKVPVFGPDGEVVGTAGIARDITLRKRYEQQVEFLARHDPLTGLFNRRHLEEEFDAFASRHRRFAVLFLDLDNFKMINDTDGHSVGDELLRLLALRLRGELHEDDLLVRLGGDEFLLLKALPESGGNEIADGLAERLQSVIETPFVIAGTKYVVSSSIGIASYPAHGADRLTLIKHADIAMYQAKKAGRHRFCWFEAALANEAAERRAIELRLREALENEGFQIHYQPICETSSGRILGVEALLRMSDAQGQPVSPAVFIPVAEEAGLIEPVGRWVLLGGLAQLASWRAQGHTGLRLSINISGIQFANPHFVNEVAIALRDAGVPGSALELEITEGVLMADVAAATTTLNSIAALGVRFAVDDFGTGYSSLAYLKHLPIHRLKIDRSFVDGLPGHTGDSAITRSILQLARTFLLEVTAEGVETTHQLEFLRQAGCPAVQGYLTGRPMSAAALDPILSAQVCG